MDKTPEAPETTVLEQYTIDTTDTTETVTLSLQTDTINTQSSETGSCSVKDLSEYIECFNKNFCTYKRNSSQVPGICLTGIVGSQLKSSSVDLSGSKVETDSKKFP